MCFQLNFRCFLLLLIAVCGILAGCSKSYQAATPPDMERALALS